MCFRTLKNSLLLATLALAPLAAAQTESTLYSFTETTNFWPQGGLIEDSTGNLYGTTKGGGTYGVGSFYELSPPTQSGGAWTETTLYNFPSYGNTGYVPSSDLVTDSNGAFYGTTWIGGDSVCNCGLVYKLVPPLKKGAAWNEKVLYAFTSANADGRLPNSSLLRTTKGIIYGVTQQGGAWNGGTIFQLTPGTGGTYTEQVLYSFGDLADASTPAGPLLMDSSGALYGVTSLGGTFNQGAVFKFIPAANGKLASESVLFSFGGGSLSSGVTPVGNLVFDAAGNLYGVTTYGGSSLNDGVAYELSPTTSSPWTETVLYTFSRTSGINPEAGMTWNSTQTALYGTTTYEDGVPDGSGSVFQLTVPATKGGTWTEKNLFDFTYAGNGGYPAGRIAVDPTTGSLYGTTLNGGLRNCDLFCGVVWQIANP